MFLYPIKISKETFKFYIMEITKENIKTLFYNSDKIIDIGHIIFHNKT